MSAIAPLQSNAADTNLAPAPGTVTLVVNVASRCGLTPQYAGLERLQQRYAEPELHRAGRAVQPVRRPGAGHQRGDRRVLLDQLRRQLPDDREGRGQRRPAGTRCTPNWSRCRTPGLHRRHPVELREVPDRRRTAWCVGPVRPAHRTGGPRPWCIAAIDAAL